MSIFTIALIAMLGFVVVMGVSLALALRAAVGWSRELAELQQFGTETSGRVVEKRQVRRRGTTSTHIRYEYTDQFGSAHRSRRTLVTPEAWASLTEGGPIDVVYSQRKPAISLPKYLLSLDPSLARRAGA